MNDTKRDLQSAKLAVRKFERSPQRPSILNAGKTASLEFGQMGLPTWDVSYETL